jgi:hypothetical protein
MQVERGMLSMMMRLETYHLVNLTYQQNQKQLMGAIIGF